MSATNAVHSDGASYSNIVSYVGEQSITDNDLLSPDIADLDMDLDTMDTVVDNLHTSQMDTMDFLPIWFPEFDKWIQICLRFVFIPLSPIITYSAPDVKWKQIPNVIEAHTLIGDSGQLNFLGVRIPVQTNLKVLNWRKYLAD